MNDYGTIEKRNIHEMDGSLLLLQSNSKLCAAALASLSVPHHHLAPLVKNPPELDFPLRGRAVSIRQFSTHVSLKI